MNSDIRISTALLNNKKIRRLVRQKGRGALFGLMSIWIDAAIHRPEGRFDGYEMEDLMDVAETTDETFIGALVALDLLDFDGEIYAVHNWEKHNLWASKADERVQSARRAAEARWKMTAKKTDKNNDKKQ